MSFIENVKLFYSFENKTKHIIPICRKCKYELYSKFYKNKKQKQNCLLYFKQKTNYTNVYLMPNKSCIAN